MNYRDTAYWLYVVLDATLNILIIGIYLKKFNTYFRCILITLYNTGF